MNGATPDPTEPARDPDAISKLQLTRALQRARYAIAWERSWPHLARFLTVVGLFLVVSWAGLWLMLPFVARAAGLGLFVLLALATLFPLSRFRWPSREEGLSRLDRGIRHRPATTLTDTLATQDPVARALWLAQRERTLASIKRIRAGLPSPRLALHDPWALRALVAVLLVATYVAAGGEHMMRTEAAFDWNGVLSPANVRVDAWVTPPLYTSKPSIILSAANKEAVGPGGAAATGPLPVPAGSTLIVRSSGGALDVAVSGNLAEAAPTEQAPQGTNEKHFIIAGDGSAHVRAPSGQPQWKFSAITDHTPTIALAKDPERQARGSLLMSYRIEDDYGVTEAQAHFAARPAERPKGAAEPRPLFDPPQFSLVLPNARTRNGVGQTVKDLSADPYAGADVTLTLTAKDEAGNEGKSEPFNMRLPERLFTKPLARALIEQRRILALDANQNDEVSAALDALMIAPELFTPQTGQYLGLYNVARQLETAHTDDALREVVVSLWALAVTIEDGNITDVDKALRAAQDALKQALERGASDEEIKKLTEDLRAALDNFMRQLTEQFATIRRQLARQLDPNAQNPAPTGSQQHDRAHGAAIALRRQGCRQATAGATPGNAGKPADGAAWSVRQRGHGAGAQRTQRRHPQAAAIARQDLQARSGFTARPDARQARRSGHGRSAARPAGPARPAQEAAAGARPARHDLPVKGPAKRGRRPAKQRRPKPRRR